MITRRGNLYGIDCDIVRTILLISISYFFFYISREHAQIRRFNVISQIWRKKFCIVNDVNTHVTTSSKLDLIFFNCRRFRKSIHDRSRTSRLNANEILSFVQLSFICNLMRNRIINALYDRFLKGKHLHNRVLYGRFFIVRLWYFTKMNAVYVDIYQKDVEKTFIFR